MIIRNAIGLIIITTLLSYNLFANGFVDGKRVYETKRVKKDIIINGLLDDEAWDLVEWQSGFKQSQPYDGNEPSQKTSFKILYDNNNIYVGIRAHDTHPDSIEIRMTRRDDIDGDFAGIQFDSYFDLRTAFTFLVSAAGVKFDMIMTNDGQNEDMTWDPIWYVQTNIDAEGWTAEMRIPFSQLRFDKSGNQKWGLQVARMLFRNEEISIWQHIPQDAPGWVHLMGELHGLNDLEPKRQIELAPYTVGKAERFEKTEGNPFVTGKSRNISTGIDGKIGVTNNLTLDFTVNPDFGQVEADPSEVNLTAYETFFEEKRPFFVEGKSIYSYNLMIGDGDMSSENLFYSRRIGRQPHHDPDLEPGEYIEIPGNTSILGAAKLSGKTKNGLSIGIMESVAAEERAEIDLEGERRFETVEPVTNYFVTRLQKDYDKGNTIIGGMFTATNRNIESEALKYLHKSAYTGGIDFMHQWKDRTYNISGKFFFSQVNGTPEALLRTQESSARYFQRPDAGYLSIDSTRTSLMGHGGRLQFMKTGGGHFNYGVFLVWKSPGLELNDVGFLLSTDEIIQIAFAQYRIWEPFSIFRNFNININQWRAWDFGGVNNVNGGNINFRTQLKNYWSLSTGINLQGQRITNSLLRGGPSMKMPGSFNNYISIRTDNRKKLSFNARMSINQGRYRSSRSNNYSFGISYQPLKTLSISLRPNYNADKKDLQYVTKQYFNGEERYIFASINQKVLGMSLRLNLSLTPDLTIQYWGQPFIAAGKYSDFKRITSNLADDYTDRFHTFSGAEISYDENNAYYSIDEDLNSVTDYWLEDPDFNVKEFRSNLVARWEYVPGSTVFFVWSQSRDTSDPTDNFSLGRNIGDLFDTTPYNVFLVKFSYRFRL